MNNIDKWEYRALRFFSEKTLKELLQIKEKNQKRYDRNVGQPIEDSLMKKGYISFTRYEGVRDTDSAITTKGIEHLRVLEDIRHKDESILISLFAIIISLIALAKSFGFI